jgi:hypothetical protein
MQLGELLNLCHIDAIVDLVPAGVGDGELATPACDPGQHIWLPYLVQILVSFPTERRAN